MKTKSTVFPLRLPASLKSAVEEFSREDGSSMNQFMVLAVAEKLSAINTAEFFARRSARANREEFLRILNRKGGESPREGDELPD